MADGVETYFENGLWKNRLEGNVRASNTAKAAGDAEKTGRHMAKARKSVHVVRDEYGVVVREDDYRGRR
ncbi:DUF2188 domain-containing protein [Amycolatopsis sp. NPDC051372]|uniref:DUF2188 domain-containing protein n=1 Tax=unclassified Amycolatopsis TaxID=2618356 RepID=UPI0034303873